MDVSQSLNYASGIAYSTIETLIGHETLMQKKEEMKQKQIVSKALKESVQEGKRITAGLVFKSNTCRLGRDLLEIQEDKLKQKKSNEIEAAIRAHNTYLKRMGKASDIKKRKKDVNSWTKSDYKIINISLKREGDEGLKGELQGLKDQYAGWKYRAALSKKDFVGEDTIINGINGINAVADDNDGADSKEDITSFKNVHTPIVQL